MKQRSIGLVLCLLLAVLSGCTGQKQSISKTDFVFDTVVTLTAYGNVDTAVLDEALSLCQTYDALLSRTKPGSDVFKLNAAQGEWVQVDERTYALLEKAAAYSELSGGCFDITTAPLTQLWNFKAEQPRVPSKEAVEEALLKVDYHRVEMRNGNEVRLNGGAQIDLGGIAKGYVADRVAEFLKDRGVHHAIIDLGGNVLAFGGLADGRPFTIGIQDPAGERGTLMATYTATDLSWVTSGSYERYFEVDGQRYHHILDPKTGYPAQNGLASVTIFSSQSVEGDALSTACFVAGPEKGMAIIEAQPGVEALFVLDGGEILRSSGLENDENLKIMTAAQ